MRTPTTFKTLLYSLSFKYLKIVPVFFSLVFLSLEMTAPGSWSSHLLTVLEYIRNYSYPILIFLSIFWFFAFIVVQFGDPWITQKLQYILDEFSNQVFHNQQPEEPTDHHRVTLFKYSYFLGLSTYLGQPWKKLWGGWLSPVLRSGHTSKKTNAIFFAPDNSDKAEGWAGTAWVSRNTVMVDSLPSVEQRSSKKVKKEYADKTNMTVQMVEQYTRQSKPLPRSLLAFPVEVNGRIWGVIVLDSRKPDSIPEDAVTKYSLTSAIIGQLLERW